eukprot:36570-Amphidinium_carterae.1
MSGSAASNQSFMILTGIVWDRSRADWHCNRRVRSTAIEFVVERRAKGLPLSDFASFDSSLRHKHTGDDVLFEDDTAL